MRVLAISSAERLARRSTRRRCASRAWTSSSRTGARSSRRRASRRATGERLEDAVAAMVRSAEWREALERYRWLDRYSRGRRVRALRRPRRKRACATSCASSAPATPTRASLAAAGPYPLFVLGGLALFGVARRVEPPADDARRCGAAAAAPRMASARADRRRGRRSTCCSSSARGSSSRRPCCSGSSRAPSTSAIRCATPRSRVAVSVGRVPAVRPRAELPLPAGRARGLAMSARDAALSPGSRARREHARLAAQRLRATRSRSRICCGRSLGVTLGTAVGVLPGIGPALTVAVLLPSPSALDPTSAFIMFGGIYYGAMYGGSTTSILLNTPGETGVDCHGDRRPHDGAPGPRRRGADHRGDRIVRRRHARDDRPDVLRAGARVGRAALRSGRVLRAHDARVLRGGRAARRVARRAGCSACSSVSRSGSSASTSSPATRASRSAFRSCSTASTS